jgi:ATP-binding cassette subfamily E protein 1
VIVVEHDLSVLDYLSDFICCLYGVPGVYGVVTMPIGVREGINIFLDGYIPAENLRFRETSLVFKVAESADLVSNFMHKYTIMYGRMYQ